MASRPTTPVSSTQTAHESVPSSPNDHDELEKKAVATSSAAATTEDASTTPPRPSLKDGEGESAVPEDKQADAIENLEDDWAHDERNPRNWPRGRKWGMTFIVSLYTLIPPLASSMMAPALPEIAQHFGITSPTLQALTLTIFLLTFALGPLIMGPLSEIYGRVWVLHICNIMSLGFNLGCGFVPTTGALIGLRLLAGFVGSAPVAIGGGVVSDLFSDRDRAGAMAVYSLGPLLGPALGPIAAGYITQTVGFKYVFVVIGGLSGVAGAVGLPLLRETYAPVIRLRLAKKSADPEKAAAQHPHLIATHGSMWTVLWVNLSRPFILLTRSFVCFLLSLYMALQYAFYYLMFSTFPVLFAKTYHFKPGPSGLAYLGLGVGFFIATFFGGRFGDKIYQSMSAKNGGKGKPEFRIPALIVGSMFVPIGLFWYGWSAQAATHWIVPIIGTGVFGFGMMTTYLPIQLYLVDTFAFAASALAASAVFRSVLAFVFPLFGQQMYHALGYGGGNSLLAGLAIVAGIPFPIWLFYYGEEIRKKSKLCR
ncbi:major facilitator superfamily domain-containing protein [Cristinia sonorae]|uniref:Major facilitator superfamily domain-containing protein n=1 Tax=Cristinia sonorae TaxID=1940300 RepID=A0A8K0XSD2_9AGAR|nr:major facilitator superfamily domain-containing protein [Cristinia sonorae]